MSDLPPEPDAQPGPSTMERRPGRRWLPFVSVALVGLAILAIVAVRAARRPPATGPAARGGGPAAHGVAPGMSGMPGMGPSPSPPPGASTRAVFISSARQQLVGVRTGLVARRQVEATLRTVGTLAYDETHRTSVNTRVAGWVRRVMVDFVGQPVRRGQPLFTIYSPELVSAQGEYLVTTRAMPSTPAARARSGTMSGIVQADSRLRLLRMGMTEGEIAALERTGRPNDAVTLYAPFDGVVVERRAVPGQYLTPEMDALRIAGLDPIWVVGSIFEYEAAGLRPGQIVEVLPGGIGTATALRVPVDFVYPEIDPQTRRLQFRCTVPNPLHALRPGTYVTLVVHGEPVEALVAPREAVIDTGARTYVLLALADGYFDPREVRVGPALGDFFPVVSGVAEGDRVVTSAQFFVDSETNLMEAMQNMGMSMPGMQMGPGATPSPPAAQPAPGPAPPPAMPPMPGMTTPGHVHDGSAP